MRGKKSNETGLSDYDKFLADRMKNYALLACFNAIGPLWNFLFLKTQDPDESDFQEQSNEIRQDVKKYFLVENGSDLLRSTSAFEAMLVTQMQLA